MFCSVLTLSNFLGPSCWHILEQSCKAMVIEHQLVSDHSEQEMRHTDFYLCRPYYRLQLNTFS